MSNQQEQRGDGGSNALHTLTANASTLIANDEYCFGQDANAIPCDIAATEDELDLGERIMMQVVGLRRLKYSIISGDDHTHEQCTSREDFQSDRPSIRYTDDVKYWGDETPYRFLLSDGINTIVGKFYTESSTATVKRAKKDTEMHSAIHRLVIAGQLKEGSIISFVPNNHKYSGKGS